jgi:hypothetical protein
LSIVTLAAVKVQLNIASTDTSHDLELLTYMDATTSAVEIVLGQAVALRTVTEDLELVGRRRFRLWTAPAIALVSVQSWDGAIVWDIANLRLDQDAGLVRVMAGAAPAGLVTAVYTAGLEQVTANIQLAALIIIQHLWETKRGVMGVRLGGDGEQFVPGLGFAIPRRAVELLGPRRPVVA